MKTLSRFLAIALISFATLTGCGGGGGGGGGVALAPVPDQTPEGVWAFAFVIPDGPAVATSFEAGGDCLVAETLKLVCKLYDPATGDYFAGIEATLQETGGQVTGAGTLHAAPGTTLPDGSTVADLTLTGTVSEFVFLNLTIAAAGVSISTMDSFHLADSLGRGSALATVAGNYPRFDIFGDPASFSIDANGVITSQSMSGCVGNGQISIINAAFNIYGVTFDVTSCGALDGMYDGLGQTTYDMVIGTDDVLLFYIFSNQSSIDGIAFK